MILGKEILSPLLPYAVNPLKHHQHLEHMIEQRTRNVVDHALRGTLFSIIRIIKRQK